METLRVPHRHLRHPIKKSQRRNTGQWEWEPARHIAREYENRDNWDAPAAPSKPEPSVPKRVTIERATHAFLNELTETAAAATVRKYKLLIKALKAFSDRKGYVLLDQWEPQDVREFRTSWDVSLQTASPTGCVC